MNASHISHTILYMYICVIHYLTPSHSFKNLFTMNNIIDTSVAFVCRWDDEISIKHYCTMWCG